MSKSGIVNVRMVITEEKILSNIDKVQKLINPKSKKQIIQLEDDTYFKDLVESIKTYLIEYPKKKNFPTSVYKAAYGLVEFATNQFEDNTKKIEGLIRQREQNIALAGQLKGLIDAVVNKIEGIKESFVYGKPEDDGDYKICCKIVYDKDNVKEIYGTDEEEKLKELIWQEVKKVNKTMPAYKYIREITLTDKELIKTTTQKIKRFEEMKNVI